MPPGNHTLIHRPLVGGIMIVNPLVNQMGTLGFIATSNGLDRWIVSAAHVLVHPVAPADNQPIHQPAQVHGAAVTLVPVAMTKANRTDFGNDIAAAEMDPNVACDPVVLNVPTFGPNAAQAARAAGGGATLPSHPRVLPLVAPHVGLRVIKSGARTGVTEGVVSGLNGPIITIDPPIGADAGYQLSEPGDSGAVWVDAGTSIPVALHLSGTNGHPEQARGIEIAFVLQSLNLQILTT